ncbi:MAG: hypothetical protein IT179_00210 [Acidobacteria bacterium]|nr:hypothetical protein [Acidobacteriota bacterium]
MATATIEKLQDKAATVADRVMESARNVETLAKDARALKARATEAFEDSVYTAKKTLRRRMHDLADMRDDTARRVKRAPFTALGVTFAAGLVLGAVVGWVGHRPRKM